jgi:steroid 5-alpha reductase family enzyme
MVHALILSLAFTLAFALLVWLASLVCRDASLADRFWSLFIAGAGAVQLALAPAPGWLAWATMAVATLWAARLALYLSWRNWGHGEDRRYAAMRAHHGPRFAWVSAFTVFGLQGVLAWVISWPLAAVAWAGAPAGWQAALAVAGLGLALGGAAFEAVADAQLARFLRQPGARGRVMDQGLWRYSRHPNYFGEACVWWGLGLAALAVGSAPGVMALLSPLLITSLLLRVSGVVLLERDIGHRRPGYDDYVRRTNAFWPGRPRPASGLRAVAP